MDARIGIYADLHCEIAKMWWCFQFTLLCSKYPVVAYNSYQLPSLQHGRSWWKTDIKSWNLALCRCQILMDHKNASCASTGGLPLACTLFSLA
jgi:hypothetical protein